MSQVGRREFLGAVAASRVLGANDRVRVAVMGVHGRGRAHVAGFSKRSDVDLAYLCDVDDSVFQPALSVVTKLGKRAPQIERDFRRILDDKSIDAISIAAPVHWYALAVISACQAGKDIYVEKPICHNLIEGGRMLEAAHKYKRVIQVGTQRRSSRFLHEASAYVRSGKLGKVGMVRAWMTSTRPNIGHKPDEPVPAGVDYDMWLGPAPQRPFNRNRFHYQWHWNWDYGAGELGNNGVHALDMVRALLGLKFPNRVSSSGGIYFLKDDRQTPDTQVVTWEYPELTLMWEQRQWTSFGLENTYSGVKRCQPASTMTQTGAYNPLRYTFGAVLYGDQATMLIYDTDWEVFANGEQVESHTGRLGNDEHFGNFIDCMRSRKRPNADIEEGYYATALCHLGNISYKLRRQLHVDPQSERFIGDEEANGMLGRAYRKPFVLPEKV